MSKELPEWAKTGDRRPQWRDDECLRHDPTRERVWEAWWRLRPASEHHHFQPPLPASSGRGRSFAFTGYIDSHDCGDGELWLLPSGVVVWCGFDGWAWWAPEDEANA